MHSLTWPFFFVVITIAEIHSVGESTFRINEISDSLSNSCFSRSLVDFQVELSIQFAFSSERILVLRQVFHLRTFTPQAIRVPSMDILFVDS